MALPAAVKIVEVGPRDGLQNEPKILDVATKAALIDRLGRAGLQAVEAASFVSPKWVPQMADGAAVLRAVERRPGVAYPVLAPNLRGFEAALAAGAREVAVFASASEAFSRRNINRSVADSLTRFEPVLLAAKQAGVGVRGYVSCALGCPYEGPIQPAAVAGVAGALFDMGCYEISLGDTIGAGTPEAAKRVIEAVGGRVSIERLAGHYHDTHGMAIANIYASLQCGVTVFDAAIAGLGGCPYAPGASGNVATEDVVYLLNGLGIATGIDLDALVDCAWWISAALGRRPTSKVASAKAGARG